MSYEANQARYRYDERDPIMGSASAPPAADIEKGHAGYAGAGESGNVVFITGYSSVEVRHAFVRKVLTLTSVMLLATASISFGIFMLLGGKHYGDDTTFAQFWPHYGSLLTIAGILYLGALCVTICCSEVMRKHPWNYVMLSCCVFFFSLVIGALAILLRERILVPALLTAVVVFCLFIVAVTTKIDFTSWLPYLLVIVLAIFFASIFNFGFYGRLHDTFLWQLGGLILACLYIVIDLQMIIGGNHKYQFSIDDSCFAAMCLYIDIVNLFLKLVKLMNRK